MRAALPVRVVGLAVAVSLAAAVLAARGQAADVHRAAPPPRPLTPIAKREGVRGEHLDKWMQQHSGMGIDQQEQALEKEPGFHELPPATQQRMRDRLRQLNSMTPAERSSTLQHTEAMERLSPEQRGEVRGALEQLSQLPPERRRTVERTWRSMRYLTPQQRQNYLSNPAVRGAFSDQEFATLNRLVAVEPLLPKGQAQQATAAPVSPAGH